MYLCYHIMRDDYACTTTSKKHAILLLWSIISSKCVPHSEVHTADILFSNSAEWGLNYSRPQSFDMDSSCWGINAGVTLPVAWAPRSIAFSGMPVIAARWPSASIAASRLWLLFRLASVTIDVISDSQPWMVEKMFQFQVFTKSTQTSWIKINLTLNQFMQAEKMARIVMEGQ